MIAYPWIGKNVTKLNWHRLDELYDLESATMENHDALFLCHQFVHSFVFTVAFDANDRLDGIMSDRQRHIVLLQISIDKIATLFEQVGNDYPSSASYKLNSKTGDYDVVSA